MPSTYMNCATCVIYEFEKKTHCYIPFKSPTVASQRIRERGIAALEKEKHLQSETEREKCVRAFLPEVWMNMFYLGKHETSKRERDYLDGSIYLI